MAHRPGGTREPDRLSPKHWRIGAAASTCEHLLGGLHPQAYGWPPKRGSFRRGVAALLYDTSSEAAVAVAERIRLSFAAATSDVDGNDVAATVSIGIAHCDGPVLEVPDLLAQADRALYFAKERGRNRVEVASLEMMRAAAARKLTVVAKSAA